MPPFLTTTTFTITIFLLSLATADHVLYSGEVLMPNQNLTNGPHHLSMQPDCNLVLHRSNKPTWSTNSTTTNNQTCYAALKQNGELVIRHNIHYILWTSGKKTKKGKFALVLDSAGRLGIYGSRRWVSGNTKEVAAARHTDAEHVLHSGERFSMGRKLKYGEYEVSLSKCNLEISSVKRGRILWETNTKVAPGACFLELESNGELTVKHGGQKIWGSNRKGDKGRYVAALRFDGRFAVYGPVLWVNAKFDDSDDLPVDIIKEEIMTWEMD